MAAMQIVMHSSQCRQRHPFLPARSKCNVIVVSFFVIPAAVAAGLKTILDEHVRIAWMFNVVERGAEPRLETGLFPTLTAKINGKPCAARLHGHGRQSQPDVA
jgi:hypothetical protein